MSRVCCWLVLIVSLMFDDVVCCVVFAIVVVGVCYSLVVVVC